MVVEGKNSGNHEGKNRTVEGNKNMKNGTIYTPVSVIIGQIGTRDFITLVGTGSNGQDFEPDDFIRFSISLRSVL